MDQEQRIKELEAENHFFRCLLEAFPVNVFVKDKDCHYTLTSRVCDMVNGVERGGLQGKTDFDLQSSQEIAQSFYDDDQRIMREKTGSRMFTPTLCGETVKYYDIFKEPILDENGQVLGILGMVVDPNQEVLSDEKEKINSEQYIEDYKDADNLMLDYNLSTNETIVLSRPVEYADLPDKLEHLVDFMVQEEAISEDTGKIITALLNQVREEQTEISRVISYFGKNQEPRYGVFTVTPLFGKHGNVERAICVVRRIEEQKLEETKRRIILKEVVGQFNERTAAHYENVIYISPNKDWFQQVQTRNDSFPETGSIKEFLEVLEASLKPEDYKQLLSAYRSYKSEHTEEKRNEITSIRFRSKGNTDTYRWKEVSIYPHASVEDADSYILAIADIDDDVKEENRIKRHDTNKQIIEVLSTIVEYRDLESGEHIRRIEDLSEILLRTYTAKNPDDGFTEEEIKIIVAASAMHDIGKIAISDTILLKPGKLTREEYDSMKEHTIKGSELVNTVASIQDQDYARYCYEICRYHHERYDGNGYPDGLAGDEIPVAAQIVSVADVYDALVSKRCYKDAYSKEQAFQMILNGECGVFSDRILQCFIDSREELEALYA